VEVVVFVAEEMEKEPRDDLMRLLLFIQPATWSEKLIYWMKQSWSLVLLLVLLVSILKVAILQIVIDSLNLKIIFTTLCLYSVFAYKGTGVS
jgi:hypothetical protein